MSMYDINMIVTIYIHSVTVESIMVLKCSFLNHCFLKIELKLPFQCESKGIFVVIFCFVFKIDNSSGVGESRVSV